MSPKPNIAVLLPAVPSSLRNQTNCFPKRRSRFVSFSCAALLSLGLASAPQSRAAAFAGAQGFGANATGGTTVLHVTNLNDSGPGSFRDAVSVAGRKIVFDVAGTITLKSEIAISSNTTIDGTTAKGGGITVTGQPVSVSNRNNVIVRNIRFREDTSGPSHKGSFQGTACFDIIVDHCSIEWGRWDCMEFTGGSHDITIQFCIIGEGIDPQKFGTLIDAGDRISIHHNLYIDNQSRNPKLKANAQYINNVVYNWGSGGGLIGGHSAATWSSDVINNYFIYGPSSTANWLALCTSTDHFFISGNFRDNNKDGKLNGSLIPGSDFVAEGVTIDSALHHHPAVPVTVDSVTRSIDLAVAGSLGCQPNDATDVRLTGYLKSFGTAGRIGKP